MLSPLLIEYVRSENLGVFTVTVLFSVVLLPDLVTTHFMVTLPSFTPFITPLLLTVAMVLLLDDHFILSPEDAFFTLRV